VTEVFVKLMNKGLKYFEHDKFTFNAKDGATIEELMDDLHEEYGQRFEVYLDDKNEQALRRDAIVFINGANIVSREGIKTKVTKGDLIVFMIAAVGG
jgi:molybdopterin converting factor small subunit